MIISYKDTENPNFKAYFYFLNGHNDVVYFSNSTFDDFESYEYNPWGVLLTKANKNSFLFRSNEFDLDTKIYFYNLYKPYISYFIFSKFFSFNLNFIMKDKYSYKTIKFILEENFSERSFGRLNKYAVGHAGSSILSLIYTVLIVYVV